jgi:hypothetical protein
MRVSDCRCGVTQFAGGDDSDLRIGTFVKYESDE